MFPLVITSVDSILFRGSARSVTCQGTEGLLTVLAHHMPFVTTLKPGTILVKTEEGEKEFAAQHGILEVHSGGATILL